MQENEDLKVIMSTELGYGKEAVEKELKDNLKKTFLGGYSKKSVFSYVERLKNTMEQMHASMEQQVNDLVREKTELVQETSLLRHQLNDSEDMVKKNQEQVSKLQQQCEELKNHAEKRALDDKEKELIFKELEEENDNYKKMEELLRIRMEEQDKLFEERRGLKLKIRNMEKETERLENELNEKRKMCEEFEQRLSDAENLEPQMLELEDEPEMESLIAKIKTLEQEKARLEELVQNQESNRKEESAGSSEDNNSKQEIEKKDEHIEQIRWQLEESKDALEFQLGRYRELEAENKILEQEKDMLRAQVYEATLRQRETEKEKQKNEALNQKIVQLEKEKAEVEEALMTMKELLDEMKNKETKISQEADEEKAAYERLQQKFNQLYQQSQELRLQLKQLEQERKASDTVLEKYQKQEKEYILLKQNNESYLGEIKDLEDSIHFMFDQMNEQAQSFKNLTDGYEDSKRKIQTLLQEKTEMQLKNVELVEQINQLNQRLGQMEADALNAGKQTASVKASQTDRESKWDSLELESTGTGGSMEIKTVDIGDIKKRSKEMTAELRDKLNKQMGGM